MTTVDWAALAFIALTGLVGLRKGLVAGLLSGAGVVAGALLGAELAPHFLSGGSRSPYTPVAALAGAAVLAVLLEGVGTAVGGSIRRSLRLRPLLAFDSLGGLALGLASGVVLVWVLGAAALHLPGQTELRRTAQRSLVLRELNELVAPDDVLSTLARVDPFAAIGGPLAPVDPPNPRVVRDTAVRRAAAGVVRVRGTSCGLSVAGSGWIARRGLVVTAAHVVAGQDDTEVDPESGAPVDADVVWFDARNDLALLRVRGLAGRALAAAETGSGTEVAILGYPEGGPLTAAAGRVGRTTSVLGEDTYGRRAVRTVVTLRGRIRAGNSGGPAVDRNGRVAATVFASRAGSEGGYGVPSGIVRRAVERARGPVSAGACTR